jgi:hypothetical protein
MSLNSSYSNSSEMFSGSFVVLCTIVPWMYMAVCGGVCVSIDEMDYGRYLARIVRINYDYIYMFYN